MKNKLNLLSTNPNNAERALEAFKKFYQINDYSYKVHYLSGQLWISKNGLNGLIFIVMDGEGVSSVDGFSFKQVKLFFNYQEMKASSLGCSSSYEGE